MLANNFFKSWISKAVGATIISATSMMLSAQVGLSSIQARNVNTVNVFSIAEIKQKQFRENWITSYDEAFKYR
jgi:hypothetical protein